MNKTRHFSTLLMLIIFITGVTSNSFAQKRDFSYSDSWGKSGYTILNSKASGIEINYSINKFSLLNTQIKGETLQNIELAGTFLFNNAGMPDLPAQSKLIAIPEGSKAILRIVDYKTEIIEGVKMAPAPIIPMDTDPTIVYEKNTKVYSADALYPKKPIQISKIVQIRGVDAVMLSITPFQYNPITEQLIVYRDVKIDITFEGGKGYFGDDRLRNKNWEPILDDALFNYSSLPKIDFNKKIKNAKDGEFEYVILTLDNTDFTDWAETIAEFRRKQGISTGVFTIADVPGGNTVASIEAWVDNMYNNWTNPPAAVLILADYGTGTSGITSQSYTHPYEGTYISDNSYADVDNDDLPDIAFARITANNASQLEVMITKFINYESNPPTSADFYNHPITALGWQTERWFQVCSETIGGFWKNGLGKDPVRINEVYDGNPATDPWSTATNTSTVVDYFGPNGLGYLANSPSDMGGWTGGNATDINNAINAGSFMLQHRDHGGETGWGEPSYSNTNIDGLTNTDLSYIMSINCLTGRFDYNSEVFAEKFHRHTSGGNNSGALGILAATQVSYSFVNDVFVWGAYDNMWPDFMPAETANPESRFIYPAFASVAGKNFLYQSSWPYNTDSKQITYRLFHHHGDPYLNVYSEVPQNLSVTCSDVHIFGTTTMDVTTENGATIAVTYFDNTEGKTIILGTAISDGGVTTVNLASCPNPGTNMLVTITKQNYFRYTKDVMVIAPTGPYNIAENFIINDGNNNEAEFSETFDLDIRIKNVGSETSEGITVTLTTTDSYVTSLTNATNVSYPNLVADASSVSAGNFNVELANNVPNKHHVQFNLEITDNSTKSVYNSVLSFNVNAPSLVIGNLTIDDAATGNADGILDPGETANIIIETSNTGDANVTNAIGTIITSNSFLTINSATTSPTFLNIGQTGTFSFNVTADAGTPIGTPVNIDYTATAGEANQYTATETKQIIIGEIPEYNIGNETVYTCVGLFSDSGGENGSYQDNENFTMTFYPGSINNMVEADFIEFDVESQSSCSYDALKIYDGTSASATLIGTYCGTTSPGVVTATNNDGALTFVFTSDGSVTKNGWLAEISCIATATPEGTLTGGNANVCVGNNSGTMTLSNNTATITSWEKRVDAGSWTTIANTTNTYSENIMTIGVWEYRAVLDNETYYSNAIQINVSDTPVAGTASISETEICEGETVELSLAGQTGNIQWQTSPDESSWANISGAVTTPYTTSAINADAYYRAAVSTAGCGEEYTNSVSVIVNNLPSGTAVASQTTVCTGSSTTITLSSFFGTIQWQSSADATTWSNITDATSSEYTTDNLTELTYFRAVLTTANCGSANSNEVEIQVAEIPEAGFTYSLNQFEATFTNSSTNATSYSWDFGDTSGTSTEENPVYVYAENGTYDVVLTASNGYCADSEASEEFLIDVVGIKDLKELGINIYPNPTNGLFNVDTEIEGLDMTIVDVTGKIVMKKQLSNTVNHIDITNNAKGSYIMNFRFNNKSYSTVIVIE